MTRKEASKDLNSEKVITWNNKEEIRGYIQEAQQ
jgi:hypothetical protein